MVEDPLICLSPQNLGPPFPTEESKNISEIIRKSENEAERTSKSVKEVEKIGQKDRFICSSPRNLGLPFPTEKTESKVKHQDLEVDHPTPDVGREEHHHGPHDVNEELAPHSDTDKPLPQEEDPEYPDYPD